ncbi:phosphomethylpyrimidine synthase [archaeon SCG-AAA382B04]|nr:phosphomethylpyrimidine synthase [archaeon SCG-AAA382B04]
MTLMSEAKKDSPEIIEKIAQKEKIDPKKLKELIIKGRAIILGKDRDVEPIGLGEGLKTKINANIGTSSEKVDIKKEIEKAKIASKYADAVMDLSTSGDLDKIRKKILEITNVPVGTVPVYQAHKENDLIKNDPYTIFDTIEKHAKDDVDFITVHAGINKSVLQSLKKEERIMDVVSRGGAITVAKMIENEVENPLYDRFDKLIKIAKDHDLALSLGDGMRSGTILDALDAPNKKEYEVLGRLVKKAREKDVQVFVEGPGHVPMNKIEENVRRMKQKTNNAPIYLLGPIIIDNAPGYDHITSAIGGAIAAKEGADFLCYVTPAEHLSFPDKTDVKEGCIAAKIAAQAADVAKGKKDIIKKNKKISKLRSNLDWEKELNQAVDSEKANKNKETCEDKTCSMCGDLCPIRLMEKYLD